MFTRILAALAVLALILAPIPLLAQQLVFPYVTNDSTPLRASVSSGAATTLTVIGALAGGNVRIYITSASCISPTTQNPLGPSVNNFATIYDNSAPPNNLGGVAIWRLPCLAPGVGNAVTYFVPPLKLTAGTPLYMGVGTAAASTWFNVTGYSAR